MLVSAGRRALGHDEVLDAAPGGRQPSQMPHYLGAAGRRLAYDVVGEGPLVLASPAFGDVRHVFRDLVGPLADAGYRVATMDLRGMGDSDTGFAEHGIAASGGDLVALVEHLGGPAVLLGSSISATAAVWAVGARPDLVSGLVLLAPHLRETPVPALARIQLAVLMQRPWGARAWAWYYASLNTGRRPAWFDEHLADLRARLRDRARLASLTAMCRAVLAAPEVPRLDTVAVPTLVVHGALDPEYQDPAADLDFALDQIAGARGLLVADAGHYPHAQRPDLVIPAILDHLALVRREVAAWEQDPTSSRLDR